MKLIQATLHEYSVANLNRIVIKVLACLCTLKITRYDTTSGTAVPANNIISRRDAKRGTSQPTLKVSLAGEHASIPQLRICSLQPW